jgi:hypothetical protein
MQKTLIGLLILLILGMASVPGVQSKEAPKFSDNDYAAHIQKLKSKLPQGDFNIVIQKPFVVIGDESRKRVEQRAEHTIEWAVTRLKKLYFKEDPDHILNVWLFRNKRSYETNAKALFGSKPGTPYGYYSPTHRALVMNISTGGGTLVHELVHPFIEANFPDCPSWFNEGLASLYEQSGERDGQIVGLTNWRLKGLQAVIRSDSLRSFQSLASTTRNEFYNDRGGANYAQARYLCYYLQEKGLLRTYYHAFVKNVEDDPTGYRTLQDVLGEEDMDAFQARWETFVLGLRY